MLALEGVLQRPAHRHALILRLKADTPACRAGKLKIDEVAEEFEDFSGKCRMPLAQIDAGVEAEGIGYSPPAR
jgi:hypothetical protein